MPEASDPSGPGLARRNRRRFAGRDPGPSRSIRAEGRSATERGHGEPESEPRRELARGSLLGGTVEGPEPFRSRKRRPSPAFRAPAAGGREYSWRVLSLRERAGVRLVSEKETVLVEDPSSPPCPANPTARALRHAWRTHLTGPPRPRSFRSRRAGTEGITRPHNRHKGQLRFSSTSRHASAMRRIGMRSCRSDRACSGRSGCG